jgi:hypothetical protein
MDAEISGFIEEVETPLSNELLLLCFFLIESSLIASVVTMPESHEHTDVDLLYSSSKTAQPEMERAFLSLTFLNRLT